MATLQELSSEVIQKIHQVAGSGVQVYSEDIVEGFLNDAFDIVFKKVFYPSYKYYAQQTIDGSTGKATTNLTSGTEFMQFDDIAYIVRSGETKPLPLLPHHHNPYELGGNVAQYVEPLNSGDADYATKLFRVWPLACTDTLTVLYRKKPKERCITTDTLHMDRLMLVYAAVWMYMKDDGTIPEMTDEYRNLFNDRYQTITNGFGAQGVEYRDGVNFRAGYREQSEWYTMP